MSLQEFEDWYKSNRNYFEVKHNKNEEAMRKDALSAYDDIKRFISSPPKEQKAGRIKKKPNPYGFN
jgi:hypothetical protein